MSAAAVFLSYRRTASRHFAKRVFDELRKHGVDVFMDVETIGNGEFEGVILREIPARPHFLLLISEGTLARCGHEDDWVRRECEEALRLERNIIPVLDDGVRVEDCRAQVPPGMGRVFGFGAVTLHEAAFEYLVGKLVADRLRKPLYVPTSPGDAAHQARVERKIQHAQQAAPEMAPMPVTPRSAAKDNPYVNRLGMKFVPVPGTDVLFSVWQTRVKDYAAYAAENPGVDMSWKDVVYEGHQQGPDHPVVNVSWDDAQAFCAWLSRKDGVTVRLPTDHEWSVAVGIGDRENPHASPQSKDRKLVGVYPWGSAWPPPLGAGNFGGQESASSFGKIDGYQDAFPFTAPVGSFAANAFGLHDLSGNAWEWCEDWYNSKDQRPRVLRGGSWNFSVPDFLLSSSRLNFTPARRNYYVGFRCVVVAGSGG